MTETLSWKGLPLPTFDRPPRNPIGHAPLRRAGSVRRTMSIDVTWPEGPLATGFFHGRARDALTLAAGAAPRLLAQDHAITLANQRQIVRVESDPPRPALSALAGARAGAHLRAALRKALDEERQAGTPLYLLLDDLAGATLVAGWGWGRWNGAPMPKRPPEEVAARQREVVGVCIGLRPGSDALNGEIRGELALNVTPVPGLIHPDDPDGWHTLPAHDEPNFRRARRIDVWREGDRLHIDAMFQDSAGKSDGSREAVHEYRLFASADATSGELLSIDATPGTLPYKECPAAPVNLSALIGTPLHDLRDQVLQVLRKTAGCTHLNDAVRALAEVPVLARALPPDP